MSGTYPAQFLVFLSLAAIIALPLIHLRQRYPIPSYLIAAGGAVPLLGLLLRWVSLATFFLGALEISLSIGLILTGIVLILDARFPVRGYLPATLTRHRRVDRSDLIIPGFIGLFGLIGTLSMMAIGMVFFAIINCVALLGLLAGWVIFRRKYLTLHWVLQRHPQAVVWVFVQQTRVLRNGSLVNVVWAAVTALESGEMLSLSTTQTDAELIVAEVAHVCPAASIGFSPEQRAQYRKDPSSLRRTLSPRA